MRICALYTHEKQGRRSMILPCKREAVGTVTLSEWNWWNQTSTDADVPACAAHIAEHDQ